MDTHSPILIYSILVWQYYHPLSYQSLILSLSLSALTHSNSAEFLCFPALLGNLFLAWAWSMRGEVLDGPRGHRTVTCIVGPWVVPLVKGADFKLGLK